MAERFSQVQKCNECDKRVQTYLQTESTAYTYVASVICMLLFTFWSVLILPVLVPTTRSVVQRCTLCHKRIDSFSPFGLPSLSDEVLTFKCGKCIVVLARKYMIVILLLLVGACAYFRMTNLGSFPTPAKRLDVSWEEYYQECGSEQILKNQFRVQQLFKEKYLNNIITWEGYIVKINLTSNQWVTGHSSYILVKMEPSESDLHADLLISFDGHEKTRNYSVIKELKQGQQIRFSGSLVQVGDESKLHHVHGEKIEGLEGYKEIKPHVHIFNQRYGLAN